VITSKKRNKHADLTKPKLGQFARQELAVYGTSCNEVKAFVEKLRSLLPEFNIGFADADHTENPENISGTHWQDQINAIQVTTSSANQVYSRRIALNETSMVIVNGNHFQADAQIIICNPEKENSLRKRADQLTNVVAICTLDGGDIPGFVKEVIPHDQKPLTFDISDEGNLSNFIRHRFLQPAPMKSLILTGGKSVRMGRDKALINYHGQAQFLHLYHLLDSQGLEPYISCREEQAEFFEEAKCRTIVDRINGFGPLGGIISSFMSHPDHAWLVVACDLPMLDIEIIQQLMNSRKSTSIATSFQSPHDKFPEPLIAIWEPSAYMRIMEFVAQGVSCPRKVLINSNIHLIHAVDGEKLSNVNTPDDLDDLFPDLNA
jgi:molybdopterin-guanine dinucleotide biosynthesis protein A